MSRLKAALIVLMISAAFSVSAQDEQTIHVVLPGDNLFRISQQYGIDVDAIAQANNITNTWRIDVGQQLIIPNLSAQLDTPAPDAVPANESSEVTISATAAPQPTATYTVGYGQNLAQIAIAHGMTLEEIAHLNNITNPDLIYAGQKLIVAGDGSSPTTNTNTSSSDAAADAPADPDRSTDNLVTHIVQPGETLASIGLDYGVSWLQIAQTNNIFNADQVAIGEELTIPGGSVLDADYSFISAPAAPPARIGAGKEIIVDLSDARTYAYEDGKLVRNVLSSPGLPATPTVKGSFKVQRKYVAQTMTGPGYYLPDVPYIMYFYAGYALHGTYWHNNFGQPMSHGCVNLPTAEAEWFYNWTEVGTPVYVEA